MISGLELAGPMVATILVRRRRIIDSCDAAEKPLLRLGREESRGGQSQFIWALEQASAILIVDLDKCHGCS
ncbi:hypothetical protein D9M69_413130 [compost metagenome]